MIALNLLLGEKNEEEKDTQYHDHKHHHREKSQSTTNMSKKSGRLSSRISAFEKEKKGDAIDDMISPVPAPKKKAGKAFRPSAEQLEKDKATVLAERIAQGTAKQTAQLYNFQESLNEEYMRQILADKELSRERCRTRAKKKKKKKKIQDETSKQKSNKKKVTNADGSTKKKKKTKEKADVTSTASVWKNRKASTSITVDPKSYKAPKKLGKKTNNKANRQLIEAAIDEGALFADPTKNGNNKIENRDQLVDAFEAIDFDAGDLVVEAKDDDHFYVVQEGQVNIKVDGTVVRTANKGDTFGELNLLYNRQDEKAIVVAGSGVEKTTLLRLNQKDYREIVQVQTKQEEAEKRDLLRKIPFLRKLLFAEEEKNDDLISRLCGIMFPTQLEAGEKLEEDDAPETLYVVQDGHIQLTSASNELFMLAAGDYIGKRPMMGTGKEPTVLSLEAANNTPGCIYSIKRADVDKVLGKNFFTRHASRLQDRAKLVSYIYIIRHNTILDAVYLSSLTYTYTTKTNMALNLGYLSLLFFCRKNSNVLRMPNWIPELWRLWLVLF